MPGFIYRLNIFLLLALNYKIKLMRKYIVFILITFVCKISAAQFNPTDYKLTWGDEQRQNGRVSLADIAGSNEDGFVVVKGTLGKDYWSYKNIYTIKGDYKLEHYDRSLNKDKEVELDLSAFGNHVQLLLTTRLKDKLYYFVSVQNRDRKDQELWLGSADYNTLQLDDGTKKLVSLDYDDYSKNNSGKFNIRVSRDQSKLIVYYRNPGYKDEKAEVGFMVFDDNMNLIYKKDEKLKYEEDLIDLEKMYVDDNGNAFSLFKIYKDKRNDKKKGEANYYYLITSYTNQGEQIKEYKLAIPGFFITDMSFTVDRNGQIIVSGFYSEEGTLHYQGTYFKRIDSKTGEILKSSQKAFTPEFVMQNLSGYEARKNKRKARRGDGMGLSDFTLGDIVLRKDGGCVLVAEQYIERQNYDFDTRSYTYSYYEYNDILVVNIGPDGEIKWSKKFPKRQTVAGKSMSFASYTLAVVNNKIVLIYNDDKDNLELAPDDEVEQLRSMKKAITVLAIVDSNGKEKKLSLFSQKDAGKIFCRPTLSEQIDDNTLLIYCERGKSERFAKVKL